MWDCIQCWSPSRRRSLRRLVSRTSTRTVLQTPLAAVKYQDVCHFIVSDYRYLAPSSSTNSTGLVSVFRLPDDKVTGKLEVEWVRKVADDYQTDDVFQAAFLATVLFTTSSTKANKIKLSNEARDYLRKLGNTRVVFLHAPLLLPGPYLMVRNQLRDVWRLYDDTHGTCMVTLKPQATPQDSFATFQWMGSSSQFPSFAIRSRIKTTFQPVSPIAGLRIIVKDNIHLKGTRTSQGNKAFYNTYPAQEASAPCIQRLVDKGVTVAGKSKMNSFGNWEEPLEYIDFQAPWNARGDGYQSTGGSSSGSAAALAAYEFLDLAIGTDTWGSVTRPALWCGLFGLRPSFGAVPSSGIEPFCGVYDTAGLLGRDLKKCRQFAAEWLDDRVLVKEPKPFGSIVWATDFWDIVEVNQQQMARNFIRIIKDTLTIECHDVSFSKAWAQAPPAEANGLSLVSYIDEATAAQCYDALHNCQDFRTRYKEMFKHEPYISPPNQRMWDFARTITKEKRDEGFDRLSVYRKWFRETIFSAHNSNPLVVMPLESMRPRYRDEAPDFKRPPQPGVNPLGIAAVLECPVLSVPVSEIAYHSRITDQEEQLPFVVAVMSKQGKFLLQVLKHGGMPTTVQTGRSMFQKNV
ncbi:amidase signature domain-containing protein [Triangularia verruculosa]|uniref:Amidase signature domain-containing protein n=1 Tax=Triangularia verruculosa TaxID=2587418 RepID=A0AAN6XEK1_9PEZI|nr:amidase signature domain-containing protein [Triangularia verruculosa]